MCEGEPAVSLGLRSPRQQTDFICPETCSVSSTNVFRCYPEQRGPLFFLDRFSSLDFEGQPEEKNGVTTSKMGTC